MARPCSEVGSVANFRLHVICRNFWGLSQFKPRYSLVEIGDTKPDQLINDME